MKALPVLLVVLSLACTQISRATTVIYPVEAIADLWSLPSDEFREKYAGINITGLGPSDEGWYVRYRHENLICLFGPLAERDDARTKKWDMEAVRDAAIRNRPSLQSSQVDFVRFTFSGVYGKRGDGAGGGGAAAGPRISADGKSGPDGDLDGDGIPNALDDDMDGDGIPNAQDPDADGDGIPNEKDDYAFGSNPDGPGNLAGKGSGDGAGEGEGGSGGKSGQGNTEGDRIAGKSGEEGSGNGGNGRNGNRRGGQGGQGGQGGEGDESGGFGQERGKVASNQGAGQRGTRGGQSGQSGASGQSGQQGSSSQQSGGGSSGGASSSEGGQPGGGGGPPSGGSSGGGGNPLSLVGALLRMILGL